MVGSDEKVALLVAGDPFWRAICRDHECISDALSTGKGRLKDLARVCGQPQRLVRDILRRLHA